MILFSEAIKKIEESIILMETEKIDFKKSINRVLAESVYSDIEMPPFNKSAMDGYACKNQDIQNELKVIEIIPAGVIPQKNIGKNECSKIMTGAMMPEGSDCVIIVENVEETGDNKIKYLHKETRNNICFKAEDIKQNEQILPKGTFIKPQHIAVLATTGNTNLKVYKQPKIAVLSTGDELVEPYEKPEISKIRNSNAYQIISQLDSLRINGNYMGIVEDTEKSTYDNISKALEQNDVVLLTGGVSMGDFDFVPKILKKLNIKIHFDSIAVQPGRPTTFGTRQNKYVFGLPGNPVSSFVQFELLVKPFLYKMMGYNFEATNISLKMGEDYSRKNKKRMSWIPISINENSDIIPLKYHGSAHINALTYADGLINVPVGKTSLKKGDFVNVRQIWQKNKLPKNFSYRPL